MAKMKAGDTAFIVESNRIVREVEIKSFAGGMYLIKFKDSGGGIKGNDGCTTSTSSQT